MKELHKILKNIPKTNQYSKVRYHINQAAIELDHISKKQTKKFRNMALEWEEKLKKGRERKLSELQATDVLSKIEEMIKEENENSNNIPN